MNIRCAIINNETNIVENVIELSKNSVWRAPDGFYLVVHTSGGIGNLFQDGEFIDLNPPVFEPE